MFEKLSEFLINHEKEYQKTSIHLELWEHKKIFLETFLVDCLPYLNALSSVTQSNSHTRNDQASYKDAFDENLQTIRVEDIRLPAFKNLSDISTSQLNDFWAKIFRDDTIQVHYFKNILSTQYLDTDSISENLFILYLQLLIIYYAYIAPEMSLEITLQIDFFTTQLVWFGLVMVMESQKFGPNFDRTTKSTKAKRKGKAKKKQEVIETYYKVSDRKDLTPHRIATSIMEILGKRAPSTGTIKRYLKEEGIF